MLASKKELEIVLSKLKSFSINSVKLEQYLTPSEIAADWLWQMHMHGEVTDKTFVDLGCGTGILGLGLLLLGAAKVTFVDSDKTALDVCTENYTELKKNFKFGKAEFVLSDVSDFKSSADGVVQNPPFGTKIKHADKQFLEVAFRTAPLIYSMHKSSTSKFVEAICKDLGFRIVSKFDYSFPIKAMFKFHQKPVRKIEVSVWKMIKEKTPV